MDLGISGRVAVVTGGSRGNGLAIAEALLNEGAAVVVTGRDKARLDKACGELGKRSGGNGRVLGVQADLGDAAAAANVVDKAVQKFGRLDILINNAAAVRPADFMSLSDELFGEVFEEKLNLYARVLRHAIPVLRKNGWGRIINISGLAGRQPHLTTITVGLNNSAVLNLTKGLAGWLAKDNITVNAVVPHLINTDTQDDTMARWAEITGQTEEQVRKERIARVPLGRLGRPEEVGAAVAFLASERASFITGAALTIDGGVSMSI
jgi:NAD(P)-dependent dehydrogenase (short-subunit alcohol dehydrogenase family)